MFWIDYLEYIIILSEASEQKYVFIILNFMLILFFVIKYIYICIFAMSVVGSCREMPLAHKFYYVNVKEFKS